MAKLRRNHASRGTAASAATLVKVSLFAFILLALIWAFVRWNAGPQVAGTPGIDYAGEDYFLPAGTRGQVIDHGGFVLSYREDWEQAEWVAYILTRDHLDREWTKRDDHFRADPQVKGESAGLTDYRGSGYDRGHLAPFADFAWDAELADATFYLSNISPQARQFNGGIWRELEELTRDWARRDERLYVVTGPVIAHGEKGRIGHNQVAIPEEFYKVLLDLDEPQQKGIGFLIPNAISFEPLTRYAVSIDEVEAATGIDFFAELMPQALEDSLERVANPDFWPFSKQKFDRRVGQWNKTR